MKKMAISGIVAFLVCLSFHSFVLAAETKGTIDPVSGKPCYRCHASKMKAPFVHSGLADKECTPCHSVSKENHQKDYSLNGVKDKSSKVCYECHENKSKKKSVHGPIQEDNCLGCHAPHKSNFQFQLGMPVQQLCVECHDKSILTEKESSKTGFRDGNSNFHYLHAGEKTAIPCLACHDVHASDQAKLIRPKGKNGKEDVTLTFKETDKGGNCTTSCHDALGYERK